MASAIDGGLRAAYAHRKMWGVMPPHLAGAHAEGAQDVKSITSSPVRSSREAAGSRHPPVDALVVFVKDHASFQRAVDEHWYHLLLSKAPPALRAGQIQTVAFYLPRTFGVDAFHVTYAAPLLAVTAMTRGELFPHEPDHERSRMEYMRLSLGEVERLPHPIPSRRWRRLVVCATTLAKLEAATEINDLFHASPLEDRVWNELKKDRVPAEREYFVPGDRNGMYALDFAIFGQQRNLDVECDGDLYHATPIRARYDNRRNNFLTSRGWSVLRFDTMHIREELPAVMAQIQTAIRDCGGLAPYPQATARAITSPQQPALWGEAGASDAAAASLVRKPRRKRPRATRKGPPHAPAEQPSLW
jgi:very-short-patch-repair endonuclease